VIAMHGWSGTAAGWEPWRAEAEARGWRWRGGERGYGAEPPFLPDWGPEGLRVLITHSMGAHLLPPSLLANAERVVLLAGFGRFVPPGREVDARRRLRHDLALLEATADLPKGFPEQVPVLLVEAGDDRIVGPKVRELLRQRLPAAERILLPTAGHAFLTSPPLAAVLQWLERTGPS
jgi:pimeloyl-[acyl-carrier protein] methyl ester esterase